MTASLLLAVGHVLLNPCVEGQAVCRGKIADAVHGIHAGICESWCELVSYSLECESARLSGKDNFL